MSTLYDRLESDIKEGLANNDNEYPAGTRGVRNSLRANYSWLDLTIGEVHSIIMFSDMPIAKIEDWTFKFGKNIIKDEK
jgi:hypothetical protein